VHKVLKIEVYNCIYILRLDTLGQHLICAVDYHPSVTKKALKSIASATKTVISSQTCSQLVTYCYFQTYSSLTGNQEIIQQGLPTAYIILAIGRSVDVFGTDISIHG